MPPNGGRGCRLKTSFANLQAERDWGIDIRSVSRVPEGTVKRGTWAAARENLIANLNGLIRRG